MSSTATSEFTVNLAAQVRAGGRFLPVGGATKPSLLTGAILPQRNKESHSQGNSEIQHISMASHQGIEFYDPSEFLITAKAGTTVRTVKEVLAERGQYLPFDPLFCDSPGSDGNSTLGGAIASGLSGSNCMLYGRLRDFVMEVELIDGLGKIVRGGGKVVKNTAGFDLPKLMVGSYGRLGILTEITLKVFPTPFATRTLRIGCPSLQDCFALAQRSLSKPLPIAAFDITADSECLIRVAGPTESLQSVAERGLNLAQEFQCELVPEEEENDLWTAVRQTIEAMGDDFLSQDETIPTEPKQRRILIRAALPGTRFRPFTELLRGIREVSNVHFTGGGTTMWLELADANCLSELDAKLQSCGVSAIALRGHEGGLLPLGNTSWLSMARRIQMAIDPNGCFPPFASSLS